MGILLWILSGAIALCAAWFLLQYIVGRAVPRRVSGELLLRQEFKKIGVRTDNLPPQFFAGCVEWAEGVAKMSQRCRETGPRAKSLRSQSS
jgi:hypothetical protein